MSFQNNKLTLVVGGGISGITTAVEIAEAGKEVILVEKEPFLGGNVIKMNNYFPKLCPPACGQEINFRRIRQNPRIKYFTSTTVSKISGEKNNFNISLISEPEYVKDNCTACGKCSEVCPEERPDEFNYGFTNLKAVDLPHEMAFPFKFYIDDKYCKKELCNKCVDVCVYNAIDFTAKKKEVNLEAGSVVFATGWRNYDAAIIENLHYSDFKNVVTNVEFERLISSNGPGKEELMRPFDKKIPKEFVFVQCAGSRDKNYLPYCSAVCCSASLKHALTVQEKYPDSKIKIFYIDLRVSGRNEDFLRKVEENENIELIKGKVAKIDEINKSHDLEVEAEDILSGRKKRHKADLVILATGIVPSSVNLELIKDSNGFFQEIQEEGIEVAACCKKPMDVSASVKDATGAALKAIQITGKTI